MRSVRLFTVVALVLAALAIVPSAQAPKSPQAILQAAQAPSSIQGDFRRGVNNYEEVTMFPEHPLYYEARDGAERCRRKLRGAG